MAQSLASLLVQETKASIYQAALDIAEDLGLPVTTWAAGDPTRSLYHVVSTMIKALEDVVVLFISAGFLDYATGEWLILLAKQAFNVDAIEATYAEADDYVLTNTGGGVYDFEAGDITVRNSTTEATYRNTTGGHLGAAGTLTITIVADEAGSDSSAAAGEIDELVTNYLGVTGTNPTALVGLDAESDESIRQRCRDKLSSLSPNGAAGAYAYVARNPDLTGTSNVTRVRVFGDGDTGDVTIYLATASGGATSDDRDAVEEAILTWATPLCVTPTVTSAGEITVAVTYSLWLYESVNLSESEVEEAVEDALQTLFATRPIGGDIVSPATTGKLYKSLIESAIRGVFPNHAFRVSVSAPAGDTSLTNSQVAVLGVVTPTIVFEDDPNG